MGTIDKIWRNIPLAAVVGNGHLGDIVMMWNNGLQVEKVLHSPLWEG